LQSAITNSSVASISPSRDGFRDIVERHQSRVYSIAFRILGDCGTAEEVAQDVFLALYRNLHQVQSQEHLLAWLRRVTVHRAMDACRRRASRVEYGAEEFSEEYMRLDGTGSTASRSVFEAAEAMTNIEQMVAMLPPAQRGVVLLRYQEDLMPSEISALLSMPLGTVKSHLQRALKLLRSKAPQQRKEVVHG
jgi:RNA polymerase sigma-70 factor (ECF subfamily)